MATTHTPGPWVYDPDLGYIRSTDGRDWPVGEMGETGLAIEDEHARIRADRALMAAAPEMLAALRNLRAYLVKHADRLPPCSLAGIEVIIAKAEGR